VSPRARIGLIFLVCAAPLVLGTLAWYFRWGTPGTANYGELLPPRVVDDAPLKALRGKWVLVTFDAAACDARCEKKLFVVRQVRRAQGAGAERMERLWLVTDDARPRPEVLAAIEGSKVEPARSVDAAAFPGDPREHIYVVDPLGNLMMRYPAEPDPSRMIKDLERLLKVSQIG
jgi:cytochrome oxidase Cu insertion factor (SCO1/SenC/PrrC family)